MPSSDIAPVSEDDGSEEEGFAPVDLTDGRNDYEWESKWPPDAWRGIRFEGVYLTILLITLPVTTVAIWRQVPRNWLGDISSEEYDFLALRVYSIVGGILGGTLFSMKWLYHSVAHGRWHRDRRLWRFMTPMIAGGLAFAMLLLATADIVPLIDTEKLAEPQATLGVAFLVGYFSDNAIGALANFANSVLGERRQDGNSDSRR